MARTQSPFRSFLHRLFTENESLRLDDATIAQLIRNHFPESMIDKRVGRHKNRLGIWRSDYNVGRLGIPQCFAFSYYDGKEVSATGRRLSRSEIAHYKGLYHARLKS